MSEEFETKSADIGEDNIGGDQPADETVVVEQKKMSTQMLVLIGIVLIGTAVLFFMYKKKGPESAAAATTDAAAQQTIDTFLSSGKGGVQRMQTMLKDTQKLVAQFLNYPSAAQVPLSDLHTNPFRAFSANPNDDDGNKRSREKERLTVIKAVQELQLQSVIHSESRRACMINNTLYLEGQQVGSFSIEKISPKAVVVKSGMYRFELKMEK